VTVDQGAVWNLAAAKVTFQRTGFAGIVIARKVEGDLKVLLDWRGALAFGAVAGLLVGLLRRR
jgi:tRNA-dihydrouridine synthase